MRISTDFRKHVNQGDYTQLAELYAERHRQGDAADHRKVTAKYVEMVVNGKRNANRGTAAFEILEIARKYFKNKQKFRETIIKVSRV